MITTTGLLAKSVTLHCVGCQITSGSLVPSVVGGLIGGATVFGGVLFAEYLTRKRERIWRFDDERNNLLVRGADIFIPGLAYTREERDKRSLEYVAQLMLLRSLSRPLSLVRTGVRSIIRLETMEESEHRALWGALGWPW